MMKKLFLYFTFLSTVMPVFAGFSGSEDSVNTRIFVSSFESLSENPLLANRSIEADVQCENACLVPCSYAEREKAFLAPIPSFPLFNQQKVHAYTQYFTYDKTGNTELLFAIGNEYFPLIEKHLNALSLPGELKYLPAALSALNPYFIGENGGRGIWQFSYTHAFKYGLSIDAMTDERMSLEKSSFAAALYLKDLYSYYDSWPLSILAFSSSPALVNKAIQRSGTNNFEEILSYLPESNRNHYYVFRALLFIGENFDSNRMPLVSPALIAPSESVVPNGKLHLGQISEVLQIPIQVLKELNTSLRKEIVPEGISLHLPLGHAPLFKAKQHEIALYKAAEFAEAPKHRPEVNLTPAGNQNTLSSTGTKTITVKKYHVIRSGETLSRIAQKYKVSVNQLKAWNGMRSTKIISGQKLVVRVSKKVIETPAQEDVAARQNVKIDDPTENEEVDFGEGAARPEPNNEPKPPAADPIKPQIKAPVNKPAFKYYTVKSGDTLYAIGRKYGVSYTKIKEWNGLKSDNLRVGQKLKIK